MTTQRIGPLQNGDKEMTDTTNDHRVDIVESANDATCDAAALLLPFHGLHDSDDSTESSYAEFESWILDVEYLSRHLRDGLEPASTTFLLTVGGPTVSVEVSHRWDIVTYYHSWGMQSNGQECTEIALPPHAARIWQEFAETFACHPADM